MALIQNVAGPANFTTYGAGQSLDFTLTYDAPVTVDTAGGTPFLDLIVGPGHVSASYLSGSGGTSLVFRYVVPVGLVDSDGIELSPDVRLNGGLIVDAALQPASSVLSQFGQIPGVRIDGIAPTVSSVSVPSNGTYKAGDNLDFIVNFDEAVTADTTGGTPRIALTVGSNTVYADYLSGSGSNALVFRHTLQSGALDSDGITVGALSANGGTIRDIGSNNATLTLNSVASTALVLVDGVAPTVTSVAVPAAGTYTVGQTLSFTVNLSESVGVVGTPQLALTLDTGTVYANYVSGTGTSSLVFSHVVSAGEGDAGGIAVGPLTLNGGFLQDVANNNLVAQLVNVGSTAGVLVDAATPAVTSVAVPSAGTYTTGQNLDFTIHLNEPVTVDTTGGTPRIALTIGASTVYADYLSGSGSNALVFRHVVGNGEFDGDGITPGALATNGGTIRDGFGHDLVATLNSVGSTAGVLVGSPPPEPEEPGVVGTTGPDLMDGTNTPDTQSGGGGDDAIRGFDGNDSVDGGSGADTVNGNAGNDTVQGGDGADLVYGGKDSDLVDGGAGNDAHVNGNMGADTVHGGDGADTVYGGQGNDSVYGDAGDDHISGDLGDDNLFGGAGADRFAFGVAFGHDWIVDFDPAGGDRIELAAGTAYTVTSHQGQTVIDLSGGAMLGLVGVSSFDPNWIVFV